MNWFIIPFARFPLDTGFGPNDLPDGMKLIEESGRLLTGAMIAAKAPMDSIETYDVNRSWFSLKVPFTDAKDFRLAARHGDIMTNALVLCQDTVFFRKYGFVCGEDSGKYRFEGLIPYPVDMIFPTAYDKGRLTQADLDLAATLFTSMKAIYFDKASRVAASLQYFWSACHGRWITQKILSHWAGLETLFGSSSETSYKLKHRISYFLEEDLEKRLELSRKIKDSYKVRNKVAHGTPFFSFKPQTGIELRADPDLLFLTDLHKRVLRKVLLDKTWWPIFDGKRREEAFDEAFLLGKKDAR